MQQQSFFHRALRGNAPLWQVFWFLFIPTPFILAAFYVGLLFLIPALASSAAFAAFTLLYSFLAFCLSVAASFVVWRCSRNVSTPFWRYPALAVLAAYVVWYGQRVLGLWLFFGAH